MYTPNHQHWTMSRGKWTILCMSSWVPHELQPILGLQPIQISVSIIPDRGVRRTVRAREQGPESPVISILTKSRDAFEGRCPEKMHTLLQLCMYYRYTLRLGRVFYRTFKFSQKRSSDGKWTLYIGLICTCMIHVCTCLIHVPAIKVAVGVVLAKRR